jgi:small subunit ribosomal protein S13
MIFFIKKYKQSFKFNINWIISKSYSKQLLKYEIKYESSINKTLNLNLLVDDIVKFNKEYTNIKYMKKKKIVCFFLLRKGISKKISIDICFNLGINKSLLMDYIPDNTFIYKLRSFFLLNKSFLDIQIKNYITKQIKDLISLKILKGYKHKWHYPVRGQRTRTNSNTCKKIKHY